MSSASPAKVTPFAGRVERASASFDQRTSTHSLLVLGSSRIVGYEVDGCDVVSESTVTATLQGSSLDELIGAVLALVGSKLKPATVIVSDHWVATAEVPWTQRLLTTAGAREQVHLQLELTGATPGEFSIAVDDAPFGKPRVACALPATLLQTLNQLAAQAGTRPPTIRPLAEVVQQSAHRHIARADYALALLEEASATIVVVRAGRIQQISAQRVDGDPLQDIERRWRRMKLRDAELASFDTLYFIDLVQRPLASAIPSSLQPVQLDALVAASEQVPPVLAICARANAWTALAWQAPATRFHGWQVAALALGAAVLLAAAWSGVSSQREVRASQARIQALEQLPSAADRETGSRADQQGMAALQEQLKRADVPLDDLLAAVRPPQDIRAALLGFDMSVSRTTADSTVRLSGEAKSSEEMTRYVKHLAHTPPMVDAHLARHEAVDTAQGVYRFVIEASWTP